MNIDARVERERQFHDRRFASADDRPAGRFYEISQRAFDAYEGRLLERGAELTAMELGAGAGGASFVLAERGARVIGVDISEVVVGQARERAERDGLSDRLDFRVLDAERLGFPASSFDLVFGAGILHHLDLERALPELVRVLRPGGRAVFLEPLGTNPLINAYRASTPAQRTADEHPFRAADLDFVASHFDRCEAEYFNLTSLLALVALGRPRFPTLAERLQRFDSALFRRLPPLRRLAWMAVLALESPRRAPGAG